MRLAPYSSKKSLASGKGSYCKSGESLLDKVALGPRGGPWGRVRRAHSSGYPWAVWPGDQAQATNHVGECLAVEGSSPTWGPGGAPVMEQAVASLLAWRHCLTWGGGPPASHPGGSSPECPESGRLWDSRGKQGVPRNSFPVPSAFLWFFHIGCQAAYCKENALIHCSSQNWYAKGLKFWWPYYKNIIFKCIFLRHFFKRKISQSQCVVVLAIGHPFFCGWGLWSQDVAQRPLRHSPAETSPSDTRGRGSFAPRSSPCLLRQAGPSAMIPHNRLPFSEGLVIITDYQKV